MQMDTEGVNHVLPDPATYMISELTEQLIPRRLGNELSHDLGLITSHTVSSSLGILYMCGDAVIRAHVDTGCVVSTLTETLTHQPLEDYYCYYCNKYQQYCEYCKLAPTRMYYNQYYANCKSYMWEGPTHKAYATIQSSVLRNV